MGVRKGRAREELQRGRGKCSTHRTARGTSAQPRGASAPHATDRQAAGPPGLHSGGKPRRRSPRAGREWDCPPRRRHSPGLARPDTRSSAHHTFNHEKPVLGASRSLRPRGALPRASARGLHVYQPPLLRPASTGPGWSESEAEEKGSALTPVPPEYLSGDGRCPQTLTSRCRAGKMW